MTKKSPDILTPEPNIIEKQVEQFLFDSHINPFQTRNIHVFNSEHQVDLQSHHNLESVQLAQFSDQISLQLKLIYQQDFAEQYIWEFFVEHIQSLSQNRLDLILQILQIQKNIQQNLEPIFQVAHNVRPGISIDVVKTLVELSNKNFRIEAILHAMQTLDLGYQEFYNLSYILQNLNPDLHSCFHCSKSLLKQDHSRLVHVVRVLNADFFRGRCILEFINKHNFDEQTLKAYLSLICKPSIFHKSSLEFIHVVFRLINKPFHNTQWILDVIAKDQHIDLIFYLGFFKNFSEENLKRFHEKIQKFNFFDRLKLEIGLVLKQIINITQVLDD